MPNCVLPPLLDKRFAIIDVSFHSEYPNEEQMLWCAMKHCLKPFMLFSKTFVNKNVDYVLFLKMNTYACD